MSVGNTLTIGVLESPLHGIMSKGLLVLEYEGRRSGKRYERTAAVHRGRRNPLHLGRERHREDLVAQLPAAGPGDRPTAGRRGRRHRLPG